MVKEYICPHCSKPVYLRRDYTKDEGKVEHYTFISELTKRMEDHLRSLEVK